jgi:hypothetical protein
MVRTFVESSLANTRRVRPYARQMPERDHSDPTPAEQSDDRPSQAELPLEVVAKREAADAHAQLIDAPIKAHIEAVLQNCRIALDALAAQHAHLAEHSDLDLGGNTRWAARWQLAAAGIAYANALIDLSDCGHVDSALPVSRTLHEALGVLGVVNDVCEDTILKRWLEDREVEPKKVRAAAMRQAGRLAEEAAAEGVDLDIAGLSDHMKKMYARLSDVSHIRRSGLRGMTTPQLRRAVYGRHPDPIQRVGGAASTVLSVEATIIAVGDVLAAFYGGPYYQQVIKPIQDGLMDSAAQLMALTAGQRPT